MRLSALLQQIIVAMLLHLDWSIVTMVFNLSLLIDDFRNKKQARNCFGCLLVNSGSATM
jgi:hypothetical protein